MLFALHTPFTLSHLHYLWTVLFSSALQETVNRSSSAEAQWQPTECLRLRRGESVLLEGLLSGASITF